MLVNNIEGYVMCKQLLWDLIRLPENCACGGKFKSNKPIYLLGDFNLNVLEYDTNTKVKGFLNLLFQNSFIPVINKPTRVTRNTATAIDHIITNSFISSDFHTGIIKSDISDHFPIFIICKTRNINIYNEDITVTKRNINEKSINNFNSLLANTNWDNLYNNKSANEAYNSFIDVFSIDISRNYLKFHVDFQ